MSFEITDGNTYLDMWFVYPPTDEHMREHPEVPKADLMSVMWRDNATGTYHLQYRFRYYASDEVWDRQDQKSWYKGSASPDADVDELRSGVMKVCLLTALRNGSRCDHVELNVSTAKEFSDILMAQPWAHSKKLPKGLSDAENAYEIERLFRNTDAKLGRHLRN